MPKPPFPITKILKNIACIFEFTYVGEAILEIDFE